MEESYFDRLRNALEGLERCLQEDEKYWEYSGAVLLLKHEALLTDISLSQEQISFVKETALEHLKMGEKNVFLDLCTILSYSGYRPVIEKVDTSLTLHPDYREDCPTPFNVAIELLGIAGVFDVDEAIRCYDRGTLGIEKKDTGRSGLIILTDKRIIAVGGFSSFSDKRHKLFYGNLREPFLSAIDFIHLEHTREIELKNKEIKMKYDTEYLIEKDRTFYGPYFFKFDLPISVKAKSGTVRVLITLEELDKKIPILDFVKDTYLGKSQERWNTVAVPKDYDRTRLQSFYDHLIK